MGSGVEGSPVVARMGGAGGLCCSRALCVSQAGKQSTPVLSFSEASPADTLPR